MKSYWVHSENIVFLFLCNDVLITIIAASAAPLWLSLLSHTNLLPLVRSLSCPLSEQSTLLSRDSLIVWRPHTHTHTHEDVATLANTLRLQRPAELQRCGWRFVALKWVLQKLPLEWVSVDWQYQCSFMRYAETRGQHSWWRLHVAGLYIWDLFHMYIIWRCSGRMEMKLC